MVQYLEKYSIQYNHWHTGAGTHVLIFGSSQLEGSYVEDLLYCVSIFIFHQVFLNFLFDFFSEPWLLICISFSLHVFVFFAVFSL